MRKVSYRNRTFFVNIGQEWTLVVKPEIENAMLIWELERSGENG